MAIDDDETPIVAIARDASRHGLRLTGVDAVALPKLQEGTRCRIEVHLAGGQARFVRAAEVRHIGEHGIGLLIAKPLPLDVTAPRIPAETTAPKNRSDVAASIVAKLRAVVLAAPYR